VAEQAKAAKPKARRKRAPAKKREQTGKQALRVKQMKSGIGHAETYRRTLRALGLRHHQHEIVVNDTPSVRGMLHKVRHLVRVTEEA
jgi:large subunit ribosomal protein L30